MLLETLTGSFQSSNATDATDAAFASKAPTQTQPAGGGVQQLSGSPPEGQRVQNGLVIVPYGIGASGDTFSVRVIGWRRLGDNVNDPKGQLWVPVTLCELAVTLGALTGVAGSRIDNTHLFAKTLVLTTGNANVSIDIVSPGDTAQIAHAQLDLKGFQFVEVIFALLGGSPTGMNALIATL